MDESRDRKWYLLTFIKFTDKKTSLTLLSVCVVDSDLETTVRRNEASGFHEITGSRSGERCIKESETISVTYGGELQSGKIVMPKASMKVGKGFIINPVTGSVKVNKNANYCIVHYGGSKGCEAHTVLFSINEEYKLMTKLKSRKFSDPDTVDGKGSSQDGENAVCKELTESSLRKRFMLTEVDYEERQAFLQELNLKRYQFLVSSVYRCDADEETDVSVPASLLKKTASPESLYSFSYFVQRDQKWLTVPASYLKKNSSVNGRVCPKDVFGAVAEFTAERMTVGKNGGSFVSEKDNRVQVKIPEGALDRATDFTFRMEAVDLDRYRSYGEHLPDIFNCLVGFPTSLNIEHEMRGPLKHKAQVYLPVIGDGEEKEILFLHWDDNKATPLIHREDTASSEASYYVEVDHFSTISAQTKRSNTSLQDTIDATRLLLGQASVCIILTYVVPNYMRGMPGLLVDCVELPRVKTVTKDYADDGYKELPGSRSRDCCLEENGYVTVDVGGNIQLQPGIHKKALRLQFHRNSSTNRIMVPVSFRNQSQTLSTVTYTARRRQWQHPVYFSLSDFIDQDALVRQKTTVGQDLKSKGRPPVLSEKSLSALGKALPESTWFELGLELDMTHDHLTLLMEKSRNTSNGGYSLLRDWLQKNARESADKLIAVLKTAFEEIGRVDISEVVRKATENDQPIRRADFGVGAQKKEDSSPNISGKANSSGSCGSQPGGHSYHTANPKPFLA